MAILVTGAAGFIGYHFVNALLEQGETVIGLDNINSYYNPQLKFDRLAEAGFPQIAVADNTLIQSTKYPNYSFIKTDLTDEEGLEDLFSNHQFEVVCNLAAQAGVRFSIENPKAYVQSNIVGFSNLLECCQKQKIKHLVYASSSSVYGLNSKIPFSTEDDVSQPISPYAASKKSNELMAHVYSYLYDLPTTGLRFFTVYGPWGRPDMAYFLFAKAILNDQPIKVYNHGNMSRDFTYVGDIVKGLVKVIERPPQKTAEAPIPYKIYNIGNNAPVPLMDFITTIENEFGKTAEKIMMPIQPGDVERTYADVANLMQDTGYKPDTDIQTGIKAFVDWYKVYYGVKI